MHFCFHEAVAVTAVWTALPFFAEWLRAKLRKKSHPLSGGTPNK